MAAWLTIVILVAGCGQTLPSPSGGTAVVGCRDVRNGTVEWQTARALSYDGGSARNEAIREALVQLVSQLAGVEVSSLDRSVEVNKSGEFAYEAQFANRIRQRGKVGKYRILRLKRQLLEGEQVIDVAIDGSVCADGLESTPWVVAIGVFEGVSAGGLKVVESEMSRQFTSSRDLLMADKSAFSTYHDVTIGATVEGPSVEVVDRTAAIAAVSANLGRSAVSQILPLATNVALQIVVRAEVHDEGTSFTDTQLIERQLTGNQQPTLQLIAGMEADGLAKAARNVADMLKRHASRQVR